MVSRATGTCIQTASAHWVGRAEVRCRVSRKLSEPADQPESTLHSHGEGDLLGVPSKTLHSPIRLGQHQSFLGQYHFSGRDREHQQQDLPLADSTDHWR